MSRSRWLVSLSDIDTLLDEPIDMLAAMRLGALLTITVILSGGAVTASAQFQILASHSNASFRGVDAIGNGIAWVSGTEGTILRTTDNGATWQRCSTPPGADHLDFRGIQAFDKNTAIVMSSGKGNLSRLYKTNDGCKSWKPVFTNPDKDGFWDAMKFPNRDLGFLLGDPVLSYVSKPDTYNIKTKFTGFALFATQDGGEHFKRIR